METNIVTPFIERVFMFLEDGEWDKASEYCERILDADPKNAYAYLGRLMVELRIKRKSDFSTCKKDFEQNTNYRRIIQFGDPTIIAEIKGNLAQVKRNLEAENIRRKQTNERTKQKSLKILRIILPIMMIGVIICGAYFMFAPAKEKEVVEENPITSLNYKGLSIAMPISKAEKIKIENNKIYILNGNFMIGDFLQYVKPPEGTRFYATGWAQLNSFAISFLVKNYMTVSIPSLTTNPLTGKSETRLHTATVDLQIYSYNGKLEGRVMCKDGNPPLYYGGVPRDDGLLTATIPNDGKNNYFFKEGETRIVAQYKSPDTIVEIVVVK